MPITILVAEDSVTMRAVMRMTFAAEDVRLVTVESGAAAVKAAGESKPDIVIADVSMDPMDGYELTRSLRSVGDGVPVILMSSQQTPLDEARARDAGVTESIVKPFDSQKLIDLVKRVAAAPRAAAAPPVAARAPAPPPAPPAPAAAPPRPPAPPAMAAMAAAPAVTAPPARVSVAPAPRTPAATVPPAPAAPRAQGAVAAALDGASSDLGRKLAGIGLTQDQVTAVLALSREVIERVAWEVVPDLAETIIKEEIARLTAE